MHQTRVQHLNDERKLIFFQSLLAQRPDDPDALRLAGEARLANGSTAEARELLSRAVKLAPSCGRCHASLAAALRALGEVDAAVAALRKAVEVEPGLGEAWLALGQLLAGRKGEEEKAEEALREASLLRPDDPKPSLVLAELHTRRRRHEDALAAYRAAAAADPTIGDLLNNLGVALDGLGRREEASAALRTAALVTPEFPSVHDNLGNSLLAIGRARDAENCHRRALALGSRGAVTWNNLGNALHRQGQLEEAEAAYRKAIAVAPKVAKFHTNLALTLLLEGKFAEGWREYEWRWRDHPTLPRYLRDKAWKGEELPDGTVLLQAEQGYGDTLQFVRYAPLVKQRAKRVVLACQPELVRLLRTAPGLDEVLPENAPVPKFDAAVTLLSLCGLFGTDLANVPGGVPYLSVPAGAGIAIPSGEGMKVGIAWAGRPTHGDDWNRSIPARQLEPLLDVPGVTFYSLQRGAVAERLGRPPAGRLIEVADRCADFADTAAVVSAMDLVISVDTAVVHMAGAMGKPVWVMVPPVPDFRWLMAGEATPWYPSMRLFRKGFDQGWELLIAEVAARLRQEAASHPSG